MNWQGVARSNYFRVKDLAVFKKAMAAIDIRVEDGDGNHTGMVAVFPNGDDAWPSSVMNEITGVVTEIDVMDEVKAHLVDNSVAVFMEVGNEGSRYVSGAAFAFDSAGKYVDLALDEIYNRAVSAFPGAEVTRATN